MKNSLIRARYRYRYWSAAMPLALFGIVAGAQTQTTLYGRIDVGLYTQSRSNPDSRQTALSSDTSYFGFRGQEDLGGGLGAIFKMEAQFDASAGTASGGFNRESYVGLVHKQYGTLLMGSMWGPSVWVSGKSDAFGRAQLGAVQTFLQGSANRGNAFKFDNSMQYITPNVGGLLGRVYVRASEGAETDSNHALALEYTSGRAFVGLAYDNAQIAGSTVGLASTPVVRSETLGLGASYDLGFMRLYGYYQRNRVPSLGLASSVNASASIPVGAGEVRLAAGRWNRPNEASAQRVALGYVHFLSKRTQVYTSLARLKNDQNSSAMLFPISQDSPPAGRGQDISAVGIGIRHMF